MNGKLSEIVPTSFYVYEDEDYKDEEISTNADKTLLTVSSNILNGKNGTYEKSISVMCSVRECWPKIKVHYFAGNWTTASAATISAPEKQMRQCTVCGKKEERTVGGKLKATLESNVSSVTLLTGRSDRNLKVTFQEGDSVASWRSSNTKIVTVFGKPNGTCTIKAGKKTGTAKITVKTAAGAVKTIKVKVQKGKVTTTSIKAVPKKVTVKKGQTYKLTPLVQPITSTDKIKYSSADKKVATVSGKGVIKGKKAGKTKITVAAGKKKAVCTVIVKK